MHWPRARSAGDAHPLAVTVQVAANVGGWIADSLVERGWSVTTVRKVMQTVRRVAGCLSAFASDHV